jgi:hypothetical protein
VQYDVTAMAHRIARLAYRMLKYGQPLSTTNRETANNKSSSFERRLQNSACKSQPPTLEAMNQEVSGEIFKTEWDRIKNDIEKP